MQGIEGCRMGKSADEKTEGPQHELDRVSYAAMGAAIEVHRIRGPALVESIYEEALCTELGIQVATSVMYKQCKVGEVRLDLRVCNRVILELKARDCVAPVHVAQLLCYLRRLGCDSACSSTSTSRSYVTASSAWSWILERDGPSRSNADNGALTQKNSAFSEISAARW
jgi:GxxExxY protein